MLILQLKKERMLRNETQQDVAYKARIPYADLSRIESGRLKPYPGHAKRLEEYFGMTIGELLTEVEV